MQDPASANDDLSELERQLAALAPTGRLDRDRLMYAAGRRAGQRHLRVTQRWLAVTSAGFGAMLALTVLNPRAPLDAWPDRPPAIAQQTEAAAAFRPAAPFDRVSNDPSANFRLLQQLAAGTLREAPRSVDREMPSDVIGRDAERSDSRWLLNHYLDDARTRL